MADGSGCRGYKRENDNSLGCAYIQVGKVKSENTLFGKTPEAVEIRLLQLFNPHQADFFLPEEERLSTEIDNRNIVIPTSDELGVFVNGESMVTALRRVDPASVTEAQAAAQIMGFAAMESIFSSEDVTGIRKGSLQDLRDAVQILRGTGFLIREVTQIENSPAHLSGVN